MNIEDLKREFLNDKNMLIKKYGKELMVGKNENDELVGVYVNDDSIVITTYQNNNFIRDNIYTYDNGIWIHEEMYRY